MDILNESVRSRTIAFLDRARRLGWVDLLVVVGLAGVFWGVIGVAREWHGALRPTAEIDLSPLALPRYALFSLSRGLLAYVASLVFALVYGYWAAKDKIAERVLVPALDILQSVPVLGFMPGLVLALVAIFPKSNVGLELAAVLMIFTGQAWNMAFSFYESLRAVPKEMNEAATLFRFSWYQRLAWVELPYATIGLVWNSMMSMAGGWFFLMVSEAFVLGDRDFRLPGLGAYMSVAVARGNFGAMGWALLAMVSMIVALDQFLWRPVVVLAQRFRVEDSGATEEATSWFLNLLKRSRVVGFVRGVAGLLAPRRGSPKSPKEVAKSGRIASVVSTAIFVILLAVLAAGAWKLAVLLHHVPFAQWRRISFDSLLTLARVLAALALGTLWTLPAGLAIGLSPRLSRFLQPVVQVAASFPAPMLFPVALLVMKALGISLGFGSVVLMLLGTQWYILFNVIAGAMAIPADLREVARSYRFGAWQRFRRLYLPAVFPHLVTGWVTAGGGAWNASIVAEYVTFRGEVNAAEGIGSRISEAAARADFGSLAASILVMSTVVVLFNRAVWRRCYHFAETRYSLGK